jgi:hypothetical protein
MIMKTELTKPHPGNQNNATPHAECWAKRAIALRFLVINLQTAKALAEVRRCHAVAVVSTPFPRMKMLIN